MRFPYLDHKLLQLLNGQPSIGQLAELTEENYHRLMSIAPALPTMSGEHQSRVEQDVDLHLQILEQGRYSSLILITHIFSAPGKQVLDPAAKIRLYHDAKQIDLIDLQQKVLPLKPLYQAPGLQNKWRLNLFLSKWLSYCVACGHRFSCQSTPQDRLQPERVSG